MPRVAGEQVDVASLDLALQRARSEHEFAERERDRLQKLVAQRAASRRALNEAENQERVVAFGKVVDPVRRTVPLVFEFPNSSGLLRVGMFAEVRVWAGDSVDDLAVPVSAIVDEAGQDVVYVMHRIRFPDECAGDSDHPACHSPVPGHRCPGHCDPVRTAYIDCIEHDRRTRALLAVRVHRLP